MGKRPELWVSPESTQLRLKAWLIFECNVLDVLYPPLENGRATIGQPKVSGEHPAFFMLVRAMNP